MPVRRAARCGLLAALAALVLLVAAGYADRQLKTASHQGFLPEDMPLCLYSADLPGCWLRFSRTPLAGNLADEAAPVLHQMELSLRQLTGIRPTPARWRTWLGGSMLAATDGHDWILCAHPGLAARAASLLFGGNVFRGTGLNQAWRDGFLLLSSSSGLIEKALAAPPAILDLPKDTPPDALSVMLRKPLRTVITVVPSADLPIELRLVQTATLSPRKPSVWNAPVLPGALVAHLSLRDAQCAEQLAALWVTINPPDFSAGLFSAVLSRWSLNHLPSFLAASGLLDAPISCALYGLSSDSGVPLPCLALATSAKEALSPPLSPSPSASTPLSYQWNGSPGWMFPLLGDQFSLYHFRRDSTEYLATQEALAAMIATAPAMSRPTGEDDVVIALDWKRATSAAMDTANWAAVNELLPETNRQDLDATFMPLMRALSKCGTLQIAGHWTSDDFVCSGVLTGTRNAAADTL